MQNFVDGTWMYLVHQDTPSMPSFLVNYWRHDIAPSTLPETNETSKWSRWRRDPQMMSPDSTYTVKKRRPLILGSHCQKERVFKPRFFPRNMLLFDLFGGITIFQTPHGFSIVILYMQAYKWTQIRTTRIHGLLSRPHFEILQIQEPWKRHTSCFCWTSFAGFWSMRPWAQIFAGCQEM